jgi:transcriptional regulator with XRE-family HTH domain
VKVGERIRDVRKNKRIRQKVLARMVGISPGALTNFEKGRRRVSLDWLQKISEALDTPMAYFLPDDKDKSKTAPGDPRERRLLNAWRLLGRNEVLRNDFLQLMEHLGRTVGSRKPRRRAS